MDYCLRKLLGLTEKNFITDKNWLETVTENHETVHKNKRNLDKYLYFLSILF